MSTAIEEVGIEEAETMPLENLAPKAEIVLWLESRVSLLLRTIENQEFWKTVNDPSTPSALIRTLMKELYLEIVGYQPHVIESAVASIGQMPRSMEVRMFRSMLFHQSDEFDHGEMALRDYVGLGGNADEARKRRMSPQAFAVAGMWRMIVHMRDPFAYVGAVYLFEALTPLVTGLVKGSLKQKGLEEEALEFIEFHSTEDVKHTALINHMIGKISATYPDAIESIKYGYECFEAVYPLPVWRCAYKRGMDKYNQGQ